MSGTTVAYNGVYLTDCQTINFEQRCEYDPSGTDLLYSVFRVHVRGTLHADPSHGHRISRSPIKGVAFTGSVQTEARRIQHLLMQPRGEFQYWVEDQLLLAADGIPGSAARDNNNGPKPQEASWTPVGSHYFRVDFSIEIRRVLCDAGQGAVTTTDAAVLNNRWTVSEERDASFFATRTVEGVLRLSNGSHWPHTYHSIVVPPLPNGYQRQRMRFVDSADGLSLRYSVIDKQRYASPPYPAVDWHAVYTENTAKTGELAMGEMRVMLEGDPYCDKQLLAKVAIAICLERLRGLQEGGGPDGDQAVMINSSLSVHLHEPRVDFSCTVKHDQATEEAFGVRWDYIGRDNFESDAFSEYDPDRWPAPDPVSGSPQARLWSHYLQTPCGGPHGIAGGEEEPEQEEDSTADDNVSQNRDLIEPVEGTEFQQGTDDPLQQQLPPPIDPVQVSPTLYTHWELEDDWDVDHGIAHLPLAATAADQSAYATTSVATATGAPLARRTIYIHAERVGRWPKFPLPTSFVDNNGIRLTLVSHQIHARNVLLLPNGHQRLYRMMMQYDYAMSRPLAATDRQLLARDPRLALPADDRTFAPVDIYDA